MTIYKDILQAEQRIRPLIVTTPLEKSLGLSRMTKATVYLKCEHLQHTGSFKFRGALNKVLSLDSTQKAKGVITASSGNHGQGVALACQLAGIQSTIYVPQEASPMKLQAIQDLGGHVEKLAGDSLHAELKAREIAQTTGQVFISPYNDLSVIAGQGTIGLELAQQCPNLDAVFVSVGGGGLITGIASSLKHAHPAIKIIGCWPENSPALYECIKAGKIIEVPEKPTLSDGTAGGIEPGAITLDYCRTLLDDHILVSEQEIKQAMRLVAAEERWIIEGSAGVAMAAFLKTASHYKGQNIAIIMCGRNIAFDKFLHAVK